MLNKTDRYFLTIAETGNLNHAAQQLYVSQPSLSKYIQRLESHLGTPLFDRSTSPMKLNEAGQLYLQHLMEAAEKEQQLLDQMQELRGEIRGTLRLGIPNFFGQCYLPKLLTAFHKEYPNVSIDLFEGISVGIEQALANQKIDLAILSNSTSSVALSYQPLIRESILLVTKRNDDIISSPDHIIIQEGNESLFRSSPTIMPQNNQKLGKNVIDYFSRIRHRPHVYTSTQNAATSLALVAAGLGVGFIPQAGLHTIAESIIRDLSFYTLPNGPADLEFVTATRSDSVLSVFARRFITLFQELYC